MEKREFEALSIGELKAVPEHEIRHIIFAPRRSKILWACGLLIIALLAASLLFYIHLLEDIDHIQHKAPAVYAFCQDGGIGENLIHASCDELHKAENEGLVSNAEEYTELRKKQVSSKDMNETIVPLLLAAGMILCIGGICILLKSHNPALFTKLAEKITIYRSDGNVESIEISGKKWSLRNSKRIHLITCNLGEYVMIGFVDYQGGGFAIPASERVVMNRHQMDEFIDYLGKITNVGVGKDIKHREGEGIIEFRKKSCKV